MQRIRGGRSAGRRLTHPVGRRGNPPTRIRPPPCWVGQVGSLRRDPVADGGGGNAPEHRHCVFTAGLDRPEKARCSGSRRSGSSVRRCPPGAPREGVQRICITTVLRVWEDSKSKRLSKNCVRFHPRTNAV